ncbi:tetratricopeptide repeat protein [Undibacterium cyanobacteriorum]|uniref:Tetratricopeptide repeat protein n=1 Tax=Undibacterium cyanobacteriorum TaxID=3073561 RepID=A0ABY9RKV1_9BURK|nr:tetratricopeptide repeat protein [Undibacterium sp. 20NA77.5]WMW81478.1 tetratricopeptide repeat protein [Undibacterium sp. 20NA77.5]
MFLKFLHQFLHNYLSYKSTIVATSSKNADLAPTIGQTSVENKSILRKSLDARYLLVTPSEHSNCVRTTTSHTLFPIVARFAIGITGLMGALTYLPAKAQEADAPPIFKNAKGKSSSNKVKEEDLPKVELSKELMFKLLSSDVALQRGETGSAYVTLMSVAKETRDPRIAKKATDVAMSAQQLNEALEAVQLWRSISPESFEAGQYFLSLMVVKSDYEEVESFFIDQLTKVKPDELAPTLYQAQSLLARMQDKKRAFASLERIVGSTPASVDTHIMLARGATTQGDKTRAIHEARQALTLQADSELALLTLAQASEKDEALKLAKDFIRKYPKAFEVHLAYASMLVEMRQLQSARDEFAQLLNKFSAAKRPTSRLLLALGSIELELQRSDSAIVYFQRYLNEADSDEDKNNAYLNLAQAELQKKDLKRADQWLSKVENTQDKSETWFNVQTRRALLMASDQRFGEARQFLQSLKFNNEAEEALLLQTEAQVMKAAGQKTEAFVLLEAALANYPRHPDLLYDYAMLADSFKRYDEMEAALKQLIAVNPNNPFAYNALGYSYVDRNVQLNDAEQLLKRALELAPEDPYILDSFAWLRFRQSQFEEAEQVLRRCYQLRPDPEIEIHLAEVLWAQTKLSEAKKLLASAQKKDPDNELLKSTLERLGISLP